MPATHTHTHTCIFFIVVMVVVLRIEPTGALPSMDIPALFIFILRQGLAELQDLDPSALVSSVAEITGICHSAQHKHIFDEVGFGFWRVRQTPRRNADKKLALTPSSPALSFHLFSLLICRSSIWIFHVGLPRGILVQLSNTAGCQALGLGISPTPNKRHSTGG